MADEIVGVHIQVDPGNSEQTVGDLRKQLADAVNNAKQIGEQFGKSSQQFAAAQSNVRDISKSLQEASASASKVAEGIGKSEAPIKSMRTQIREALQDLVLTQEKFGDISPEAQKAAMKVADLRDRLKDANEVATLFDPEKKFQVVAGVAQGIAAGFSAAQGAMALFGGESKQVEQALLKVQAAMALSQGLSAVKASVEDFQRLRGVLMQIPIVQKTVAVANSLAAATMRLFGVATTQTGLAFNFLKGAIIATGIGALVVVLGLVIQKMMSFADASKEAAEAQEKLKQATIDGANSIRDTLLRGNKEQEALQVARLKAAGASEDEISALQKKAGEDRLRILRQHRKEVDADAKASTEADVAINTEQVTQETAKLEAIAKANDDAEKKAKEAADKATADAKKRTEEKKALDKAALSAQQETADELFAIQHDAEEKEQYELSIKFGERIAAYNKAGMDTTALVEAWETQQAAITKKYADERVKTAEDEAEKKKEALDKQNQIKAQDAEDEFNSLSAHIEDITSAEGLSYGERMAELDRFHDQIKGDTTINEEQRTQLEKDFSKARQGIAREEKEAKVGYAHVVSSALQSFAELAGEQTAAGKAFAITSAVIETYLSATKAFSSLAGIPYVGPALGAIAAAGAIASGIANVKRIAAVQVPGKGGGGSAPSISTNAPLSPQGPQTQLTQLNQDSINNMGNATVKAIVVESDITNSQQRISRIQNAAVFH